VQVKYKMGMKNWRFSTNISVYFENAKRYGHSYNGRRIGTCMRSIEWCHFQWHWMTLTQISRTRHYSTFNISNIANTVLYVITKDKRPSTLTGRNVRLSNLLISSCNVFGLISSSCVREGEGDTDLRVVQETVQM